jgi:hypothetical protein
VAYFKPMSAYRRPGRGDRLPGANEPAGL